MNQISKYMNGNKFKTAALGLVLAGGLAGYALPSYAQENHKHGQAKTEQCVTTEEKGKCLEGKIDTEKLRHEFDGKRLRLFIGNDAGEYGDPGEKGMHFGMGVTSQGYMERERGDYMVGRIVTPEEVITYRYHKDKPKNKEMKEFLKEMDGVKKKYDLKEFQDNEFRMDFHYREGKRDSMRKEMDELSHDLKDLQIDLEKELGPMKQVEINIDLGKVIEQLTGFAQQMEERAQKWENYDKEHGDGSKDTPRDSEKDGPRIHSERRGEDMLKHPMMREWLGEIGKWDTTEVRQWGNDFKDYMQNNIERKTFSDGEFYMRVKQFKMDFPMPPMMPVPPSEHAPHQGDHK